MIPKKSLYFWQWFFPIAFFFLSSCQSSYEVSRKESKYYTLEKSSAIDLNIVEMIAPYKEKLDAQMTTVIGESTISMEKAIPEGRLNNFMADAMLAIGRERYTEHPIAFATANVGGIRIPNLPKGKITRGQIFELMPFDNALVVLKLNGNIVLQLLEHIAKKGGWPISKEVKMVINNQKIKNLTIQNEPLDTAKMYHVLVPDYVANGGSKATMLPNQPRTDLNILFRDALIQYVEKETKKGNKITVELDKRISYGE